MVLGNSEQALTRDHTPDSESSRIRALGHLKSGELLKGHFTSLEFKKRPMQRDLGSSVLYREPYMIGWAYKMLSQPDLRQPLVSGQGKRVSLLY
jgi:protein phosphatase 1H